MSEFRMPSLGADMESGRLVEWLKSPGTEVERGDIIAVVDTQKGAIEIEVFEDGVLEEILAEPGEEIPVGRTLAYIRAPGEPGREQRVAEKPKPESEAETPHTPSTAKPTPSATAYPPRTPGVHMTPAARRLTAEYKVDPSTLKAGPDGVIGLSEVQAAIGAAPTPLEARPKSKARGIDPGEMRRAIAAAMMRANREIPHYYVTLTIDMTRMMNWLAARNAERAIEDRLLYAAPLLRAVALSFAKFPDLNGTFENGAFVPADRVNIGMAIAVRGCGLITPAILDADRHDIDTLMAKLNDLVKRARGGGLRSSELSMGTATLTNLGDRTADGLMPIIFPPQVAIVGCGQISERPWVVEGEVVARQLMEITFAGDHRASDGRRGAQFLSHLASLLGKPEGL